MKGDWLCVCIRCGKNFFAVANGRNYAMSICKKCEKKEEVNRGDMQKEIVREEICEGCAVEKILLPGVYAP